MKNISDNKNEMSANRCRPCHGPGDYIPAPYFGGPGSITVQSIGGGVFNEEGHWSGVFSRVL